MKRIVITRKNQFQARLVKLGVVYDRTYADYGRERCGDFKPVDPAGCTPEEFQKKFIEELKRNTKKYDPRVDIRKENADTFKSLMETNQEIGLGETVTFELPDDVYEFFCIDHRGHIGHIIFAGDGQIVDGVLTHYFEVTLHSHVTAPVSVEIKEVNDPTAEVNAKNRQFMLKREYASVMKK